MEVVSTLETSVSFYKTRHNIPDRQSGTVHLFILILSEIKFGAEKCNLVSLIPLLLLVPLRSFRDETCGQTDGHDLPNPTPAVLIPYVL